MNTVIKEFDCDIYPRKLWIVCGDKDNVKERFLSTEDEEFDDCVFEEAFATTLNAVEREGKRWKGVVIHYTEDLTKEGGCAVVSTISHEAVHAANFIFRDLGIEYTRSEDEHFAYLVGWIARKSWNVLQEIIYK